MSWDDSYLDLVTICAYAGNGSPWPSRRDWASQATRLLATELVARLDLDARDHNPVLKSIPAGGGEPQELPPVPWHFAWRDLQSSDPPGGLHRAQMYLFWGAGERHHFPGAGTVPKTPGSQAAYDLVRVAILVQAAPLYLAVVTAVGAPTFSAARQTFYDYMTLLYPDRFPPP